MKIKFAVERDGDALRYVPFPYLLCCFLPYVSPYIISVLPVKELFIKVAAIFGIQVE